MTYPANGRHRRSCCLYLTMWAFTFPAEPQSASLARRRIRACLSAHLIDCDGAEVVTTELISNAIRASLGESIGLQVSVRGDHVLIQVIDDNIKRWPVVRKADPKRQSGRGLVLVQELSARWGAYATPTGKVVWADMRATGSP